MSSQCKPLYTFALLGLVLAVLSSTMPSRIVLAGEVEGKTVPVDREEIVREFYRLREKTLDERGSDKDVAQLLELMTDSAIYEHPRADVTMTKEQARAGMSAHLNEGRNAHITLNRIKTGPDFVVVELTLQYMVAENGNKPEQIRRRGMTIGEPEKRSFAKNRSHRGQKSSGSTTSSN